MGLVMYTAESPERSWNLQTCHSRMFTRQIHAGTSVSGIQGWWLQGGSPTETFGDDIPFLISEQGLTIFDF
ncbi:MAG: hypothetical protein R6V04_04485 [bacterium]